MSSSAARRVLAPLSVPLCAVALAACGSTVSTTGFKGEQRAVAQTISNLQADATAADAKKICANDVAGTLVRSLGGVKGCERAIKDQLAEVDNLEASIQSIDVAAGAASATARVKSTYEGRSHAGTVTLVKEGKSWKISRAQR